ncbi:predicted protein [Naegleria gruberi]|uniref:Predicted protein n=1 Tax=Naegleria gruberi TaxID=5762 RepID=D2W3X9_NAEGR|nr:uncharacterized protein NAEGRDRAFT_76105 [Naegleria gruberi]EFC36197.1 predicted protein [Naegleria gruberi]|eukprot:XP_002668941.1 predicted protein [Naegleria gruberi strain NEG-M]
MNIENEHLFYSGSYDGTIQLWDDRKLQSSLKTSIKHSGYVNSLCFYNNQIYSTSIDGISIFDSNNLKLISKSKQKSEILSSCHLSTGENSSHLYFSSKDGSVKIFDMNCNQVIFTLNEIDQISMNAMDCNLNRLYSCNNQGQVKEFDLENLYEIQTFETKSMNDLKNMDSSIRSCLLCENLLLLGIQSRKIKVLLL